MLEVEQIDLTKENAGIEEITQEIETINDSIEVLEQRKVYYEIFKSITSGTAGTVTKPIQSTILLNRYEDAGDCLILKTDTNGRPIDEIARTASGEVITSTFDINGNYSFSGEPSSFPVALVYQIEIPAKYSENVSSSIIVDIVNRLRLEESEYDNSLTNMSAINGQEAVDELYAEKEPNLPITPENPETKFLNANKEWREITIGSGGYASNIYFTEITSAVVPTYKQLSYALPETPTLKSITLNNNELLIESYIFDTATGLTTLDAGSWFLTFWAYVSNGKGITQFKVEAYKRATTGVETLLFSKYSDEINNTTGAFIRTESIQSSFAVNSTDNIIVKVYGKTTSNANVTLYYNVGDGNASYINTPLALRHSQLRGKNDEANFQHINTTDRTKLNNTSGTNTGDETSISIVTKIGDGSKISSTYLPSYVDDVLEYANFASFPVTGESGKIYVDIFNNLTYRWTGSTYIEISASLALGETSATAYRGDRGKSAYDHSQLISGTNPHGTTFANIASKPTTIAGYGITDGAIQGTAYSNLENNVKIVQGVPAGGKMYLGVGVQTGAIKIKLPKAKSNAMFKFRIKMNGQLENKISSSEYIVKGYNSSVGMGSTNANVNTTHQVTVIKDNASTMSSTFYFCTGATEDYILIGETTDIHNFKSVVIDNIEIHHVGIVDDWSKDWAISLVTTLETLTSQYKVAVIPSLNATHLNGVQETTTGEALKLVKTDTLGDIYERGNRVAEDFKVTCNKPSIFLNGINAVISVPNNDNLNFGTGTFSYIGEHIFSSGSVPRYKLYKQQGLVGFQIQHSATNKVVAYASDGTNSITITSTNALTDDKFHTIGFICGIDKESSKLFMDGIEDITATKTGVVPTLTKSNTAALNIGSFSGNYHKNETRLNRLFNYALTNSQVQRYCYDGIAYEDVGGNNTDLTSGNGSFATDTTAYWGKNGGTLTWNAGTMDATFETDGSASTQTYIMKNLGANGKRMRISFKAKSTNYTGRFSVFAGGPAVATTNTCTTTYQNFSIEFIPTQANIFFYVAVDGGGASGLSITFDDIVIQQIGCVLDLSPDSITNTAWYDKSGNGMIATYTNALPFNLQNYKPRIQGYSPDMRGANVVSYTAITPTGELFHVTGTTAIATINIPYSAFNGSITIIPDNIFPWTTGGNIALAGIAVVGKALIMTYDATTSKWYPSY